MIDEKKIEEAAEKQIETIQPYSVEERLDRKKPIFLYEKKDVKAMFRAGINWFLDNLWHDASEEPKKDRTILCEYLNCNNKKVYADIDLEREYGCYKSSLSNITRWLYIEDLMKGGK